MEHAEFWVECPSRFARRRLLAAARVCRRSCVYRVLVAVPSVPCTTSHPLASAQVSRIYSQGVTL